MKKRIKESVETKIYLKKDRFASIDCIFDNNNCYEKFISDLYNESITFIKLGNVIFNKSEVKKIVVK